MTTQVACRRRQRRYTFPENLVAVVEVAHEAFGGGRVAMPLRDISGAGVSFVLQRDMPGLEIGLSLDDVTVRLGEREIPGDLLVMHLTPDDREGAVCGGLLFPHSDEGILSLQRFLSDAARSSSDLQTEAWLRD